MKNTQKQAFTLVELIVVITILAILGTIAIMAFGGYSSNARDSRRVSDLNNITQVLELFKLKAGFYPEPTNTFAVTYSGTTAWIQGNFGDSTVQNVEKLDKKPVDPLTSSEYTYSVTSTKGEFEIAAVYEGDNLSALNNKTGLPNFGVRPVLNGLVGQTYAAETLKSIVKGTYNGKFVKTNSGSTTYILGAPSIITSEITSVDIETVLTNKSFVFNNYENLPSSYQGTAYSMTGGFDFSGGTGVLLFSGDMTTLGTNTGKLDFANKLDAYYSVPPLDSNTNYKEIVDINTTSDSNGALTLINDFLSNKIAGVTADLSEVSANQDLPGITGINRNNYILYPAYKMGDNNLSGILAQLNNPEGVVVDASGNIYVADLMNHRVKKYSASGDWILTIGDGTYGDNELNGTSAKLNSPTGLAVDSSGNIYVADESTHKIKKYSSTGTWLMTIGSTSGDNTLNGTSARINAPTGLAVDTSGNIYVTDVGNHKIKKYSSTGTWLMTIGSISGDNSLNGTSARFNVPFGVFVDTSGNIYVADSWNHKVKKYNSSGTWQMTIGSTQGDTTLNGTAAKFSIPYGVKVDSSGNIYVTDAGNAKIKKYSSTGTWLMTLGSTSGDNNLNGTSAKFTTPTGLALDTSDNIYVTNGSRHIGGNNKKVKKYTSAGNYVLTIGYDWGDNQLSGAQAELNSPSEIIKDSAGNMYIGTNYNLKKYDASGNFLLQIGASFQGGNASANGTGSLFASVITDQAVDTSGNIYIVDEQNDLVKKYSSTGAWLLNFPTLNYPNNIEIDDDGNVFVSYPYNNLIKKYSATGALLLTIGDGTFNPENNLSGSAARISQPTCIKVHNSTLYTTSESNIKKYDLSGNWIENIPVISYNFDVGSDGSIFAIDPYYGILNQTITKYTASGTLVGNISSTYLSTIGNVQILEIE